MNRLEARAIVAGMALKRVRDDRYPSVYDLDLIEQVIPTQLLPRYVDVLLEKVAQDNHPSVPLLQRLQRVVSSMP
jgi:hypothetical protein